MILKEDLILGATSLLQTDSTSLEPSKERSRFCSKASKSNLLQKISNQEEENTLLEVKPKERTWEWLYKANKVIFTAKESKNGPGTLNTDTFSYTGDWKDNKKHGYGTYIDKKNDNIYKGWWDADTKHGFGIYVYHAESGGKVKYTGDWNHNQRSKLFSV